MVKPSSDSLTPGRTHSGTAFYPFAFPTSSKYPQEPAAHLGSQGSRESLVMRSAAVCPAILRARRSRARRSEQLPAGGCHALKRKLLVACR